MVGTGVLTCPICGGELKYYDSVKRVVRSKWGKIGQIRVRRFRCRHCWSMHRELPDVLFPYKHYEAEIIVGVLEGFITCETLGFEDYPCEQTMDAWKSQETQLLLWRNPNLKGDCENEFNTCGVCSSDEALSSAARPYRGICERRR